MAQFPCALNKQSRLDGAQSSNPDRKQRQRDSDYGEDWQAKDHGQDQTRACHVSRLAIDHDFNGWRHAAVV